MTTAISAFTAAQQATGAGKRRALAVVGAALAPTAVWLLAHATGTERRGTVPAHRSANAGRSHS